MHSHRLVALFLSVLPAARPHAILTIPAGRPQSNPQGVKLTPFDGARDVANRGCGASQGLATSVIPPTQAFTMGTPIQVQWRLTIPHPADNLDTGIRISIHYGPDDSFACNILAGGLVGDPDFEESQQFGGLHPHLSAGPANAQANDLVSTIIQLPNKTCDYCVLQWAWAARADGGYYINCADIAITNNGLLNPTIYAGLPSEQGNELPINQLSRISTNGVPPVCPAGGFGGGGAAIGIIIVIVAVGAIGAFAYFKFMGGGGGSSSTAKYPGAGGAIPPPPGSTPAAPQLPDGWQSAVDPASGSTYYVGPGGETSWTMPVATPRGGAPPPPPPGPPSAALPPGWTSAVDPSSGRTYYVNASTGVTSWTHPQSRV